MKLNTVVIITKGVCYVGTGFAAAFTAATAQYLNTNESPSLLAWWVIIVASIGGGCGALLAFLSNSFQNYKDTKDVESGKAVRLVVSNAQATGNAPLTVPPPSVGS